MTSNRTQQRTLLCLAGISLLLVSKLGLILWLRGYLFLRHSNNSLDRANYTYLGDDYPRTWPIDRKKQVLMGIEDSSRYDPDTPEGRAEWEVLIPGDGIIHLGEQGRPFSISMFHQLRCLDILREGMVEATKAGHPIDDPSASALHQHCLNYLRQMIFCRSDTYLESLLGSRNPGANLVLPGVYQCNNWDAVYEEVRKNQDDF
ncbi:hypothetical protein BJ138DRAFT_1147540 [Hygrophoropsis aurantiaca]|uniref:Uncharacterized protein n=1 Tax=Hygrophoropsis aurantiaca TaxID=72124 RepID=A0ACB8AHM6_9AGAM|nr:hypothetical protein BJ138DRAFT_1147540 [Hygrophoropsis aurantiaca]